jgi:hypothetical protein
VESPDDVSDTANGNVLFADHARPYFTRRHTPNSSGWLFFCTCAESLFAGLPQLRPECRRVRYTGRVSLAGNHVLRCAGERALTLI